MSNKNTRQNATKLGIELLEDRTVPTTFGIKQGESLAVGHVINGGTDVDYVTGSGPGTLGLVQVFDANGNLKYKVTPFAGYTGGVNVAVGDVTGNISSEAGVSSASFSGNIVNVSTSSPHGYAVGDRVQLSNVNAFDPTTGMFVYSYDGTYIVTAVTGLFSFQFVSFPPNPLPPAGRGGSVGVFQKDIICSTTEGSTGRVRVYTFANNQLQNLSLIQPFGPNYVGGVQITTGNVTGNFAKEIIVGQQTNGSVVKAFAVDPNSNGKTYFEIRKVRAFEAGYKGGVSIASTNIDTTAFSSTTNYDYTYDEVIVGKAKDAPLLNIYDLQLPTPNLRASYFAFDPNINNAKIGVNVAAGNTDGLRGGEIYASLKNSTTVRIFRGETGVPDGDFTVPYPIAYGRNLEIAIDDLTLDYLLSDIYIVASDGPRVQVPVIYTSVFNSPAGLNGSHAAP
ncbi:MAG: hypothetical protein K8U57_30615 [Planctomycetes bacterium]|nr:hypothetical protein [Planctomycetota bacterium]